MVSSNGHDRHGTFTLDPSSEPITLVSTDHVRAQIGTTWNLTIRVSNNSSSAINVSFWNSYIREPYWWEGEKTLFIHPNETYSELYISHITGDTPLEPLFLVSLVNNTGQAQGFYNLTLLHPGYSYFVGTSRLYVSDIFAWIMFIKI